MNVPSLPTLTDADAVVYGGGFGGVAAAVELARAGRRVLLIEPRTYLGRQVTASLRPWLMPTGPQNMDTLKIALEDEVLRAGVRLIYASLITDVLSQGELLQGIVIGNKSGRQIVRCRLLLDASETGLVSRLLREPFLPGPARIRYVRRTLEFENVALADILPGTPLYCADTRARLFAGTRGNGHVLVEWAGTVNGPLRDAFDFTRLETDVREESMQFAARLVRQAPEFAQAVFAGAAYEVTGLHGGRPEGPNRTAGARMVRDVWYLNEVIPPYITGSEAFNEASFNEHVGHDLGVTLNNFWPAHAAPETTARIVEPDPPPVLREVDVLVVGGGSSGATAAITAAREGLRVLLVEMNPGLGGTGTFGGVQSYWFGRRLGFAAKLMERVAAVHTELGLKPPEGTIPRWNIEAKSHALLLAAREAGVELLFNAVVTGAEVEGGRVTGVTVATWYGPGQIRAKVVIDASGDGDVAAFAGAAFGYGHPRDHSVMWTALAQFTRPGQTRNHFTSMVDVSNVEDVTRGILAGRRRGGKGDMHDHGVYLAPRESRHIMGEVVLTLNDQLRRRAWPDAINVAFSNHDVKGQSGSDWLRVGLIPPNLEIEIPYRAILPKGIGGLLVVGKALSATHDALPAIRMQADLENLGGAAALAAAQAVKDGVPLREIDLPRLQARLMAEGVLPGDVLTREIHETQYTEAELQRMIAELPVFPLVEYSDMELTGVFDDLIPLVEICCAGPRVVPLLEAAHAQAEGERRVRLAQMLALVGSAAGVPALIEVLMPQLKGDTLPVRTAHIRYTQLPPDHGAMPDAAYLLYSLGMTPDARAIPVWKRLAALLESVSEDDFQDHMKGTFYYVDALCHGVERLASAALIDPLERLHRAAPFYQRVSRDGFEPDIMPERFATLELIIGRALARCGSAEGYLVLISYLQDNRALLAKHAHSELAAITGEDFGADAAEWGWWLEQHGDALEAVPWREKTEAMQAWE